MADKEPVIGIDLGTTNSVVATVQGEQPLVIRNRSGQNLTPSVVAVASGGKRLVGQIAKRQAITNPAETVYAAKRLIGRKFSSAQVQEAARHLPYRITAGQHDDVRVELGGNVMALPEISALVLAELKSDAGEHFGRPVTKAVITVPAYFNDGQRQATKDAGLIAGLDVLRIVNEPTAAALAYGFGKSVNGKIAIFDLGGGTFDISILDVGNGVFDVVATGGDTYLGGEDFDRRIMDWLCEEFQKEHSHDLRQDRMALQRLKDAAEKAKIELSQLKEVAVSLPFIFSPPAGGTALHLQRTLTRKKFEELTDDLSEKTLEICEKVLKEAKVKPGDLKEVILVGGMTRVPRITELAKKFFKKDPCKGVHPDEVVALGAAIQGYALTHEEAQVLLLDVTPHNLGVAVAGGFARTLIPKNTSVPTATSELFSTSKDAQTTVKIMVLQGESPVAFENELLGEFMLGGLRPAPRGEVIVEVTFDINAEGIVSVAARDKETGQQQSITVTASGGLTPDELKKILEAQKDYLVAASGGGEGAQRKLELERGVKELEDWLSRLRAPGAGKEEAALAKQADKLLSKAKKALASEKERDIAERADQVAGLLELCKGVARAPGGAGE